MTIDLNPGETFTLVVNCKGNPTVIPELEKAVLAVSKQAQKIDQKVPDKNVPPGTKPPVIGPAP